MRLVPALQRRGLCQRAVIRRHAERARILAAAGVRVRELGFGGPVDLLSRWRLAGEVRAFRPDVVVSWMNRATAACPSGGFVHVARLGGYYDPRYYRRCDHLVANTRDLVDHLTAAGFPAQRVHYLPNFPAAAPAPPLPRAALATPAGAPLVVALGRLHRNKAFDVLIRAMADLPGAHLWLAGEGPERDSLDALARQPGTAGRVHFLGWRADIPALLAAADVFVCPSRHEPLGNVVLEAWAHGAPVVAAASQGPSALVRDGETGLLAPVDDPAVLAAAIARLLADRALAARLTAAGRAVWAAEFSEPVVVGQWLSFLHAVSGAAGEPGGAEPGQRSCAALPA